jgi:hypothetical protein
VITDPPRKTVSAGPDVAVSASALAPGASTAAAPAADIPRNLRRVVRNSVTGILLIGRPGIIATGHVRREASKIV